MMIAHLFGTGLAWRTVEKVTAAARIAEINFMFAGVISNNAGIEVSRLKATAVTLFLKWFQKVDGLADGRMGFYLMLEATLKPHLTRVRGSLR